jgi:hypothetical protein
MGSSSFGGVFRRTGAEEKSGRQTQRIAVNTDMSFEGCLFEDITYSGEGGAIYCAQAAVAVLVDFTAFSSCSVSGSSKSGGAVFFQNGNSIVFVNVCATSCTCTNAGLFAYANPPSAGRSALNFTSFSKCRSPSHHYTFYCYQSAVSLTSANSSFNEALNGAGFIFNTVREGAASFTQIANNSGDYRTLYVSTASPLFSSCNIVRNICRGATYGPVDLLSCPSVTFAGCAIVGNGHPFTFCLRDSEARLIGCSAEGLTQTVSGSGTVTISGPPLSGELALPQYASRDCYAEIGAGLEDGRASAGWRGIGGCGLDGRVSHFVLILLLDCGGLPFKSPSIFIIF